jgi:hypothetical protein
MAAAATLWWTKPGSRVEEASGERAKPNVYSAGCWNGNSFGVSVFQQVENVSLKSKGDENPNR